MLKSKKTIRAPNLCSTLDFLNSSLFSLLQQKIGETNQRLLKEGQAIQNTITPYPEEHKTEVSEPEPLKASVADTENQEKESVVPGDDGITLSASDKSESIEPSLLDDVEKTPEAASRS